MTQSQERKENPGETQRELNKIYIKNFNQTLPFDLSKEINLLNLLRINNIPIKSSCQGHGQCAECVVKVIEGMDQITELSFKEKQLLGNVSFITKERLACQIELKGPLSIEIPKS